MAEQVRAAGFEMAPVMQVQSVAAIPLIVASSDLVALTPREVFVLFDLVAAIRTVALPLQVPPVVVHEYWHQRMVGDPANQFFRDFVCGVARE